MVCRAGELREYVAAHGDAHVGFREQDDAELARWAAKQRKDWKSGDLAPDRCGQRPLACSEVHALLYVGVGFAEPTGLLKANVQMYSSNCASGE